MALRTYKIGEIAGLTDLKPFVLRFWESEFPQLVPVRTPKGQRLYTEEHLALVRRIKTLLYDEKLTIDGARRRLAADAASGPGQGPGPGRDVLREVYDELLSIRKLLDG
jgi:DNA-binding transcriptional MerR regulator